MSWPCRLMLVMSQILPFTLYDNLPLILLYNSMFTPPFFAAFPKSLSQLTAKVQFNVFGSKSGNVMFK